MSDRGQKWVRFYPNGNFSERCRENCANIIMIGNKEAGILPTSRELDNPVHCLHTGI